MHTLTILSTLLLTHVLAIPNPQSKPQEDHLAPAALLPRLSESFSTSTIAPTTISVAQTSTSILASSPSQSIHLPTITPKLKVSVYICTDINWSGDCHSFLSNASLDPEDCTSLTGDSSSIGPDKGFTCWFYTNKYCRSTLGDDGAEYIELSWPGTPNLEKTIRGNLNDRILSYHCLPNGDPIGSGA